MADKLWADQTKIYCLRDDVHRRCAGIKFGVEGSGSIPFDEQVEANAASTAGQVWAAAKRYGGETYTPDAGPHGTDTIPEPAVISMVEGNAIGAARICVEQMLLAGDDRLRDLKGSLDSDWLRYIGDAHVGGKVIGEIGDAVSGESTLDSMSSDVDGGESTLEAIPNQDVRPEVGSNPNNDPTMHWD